MHFKSNIGGVFMEEIRPNPVVMPYSMLVRFTGLPARPADIAEVVSDFGLYFLRQALGETVNIQRPDDVSPRVYTREESHIALNILAFLFAFTAWIIFTIVGLIAYCFTDSHLVTYQMWEAYLKPPGTPDAASAEKAKGDKALAALKAYVANPSDPQHTAIDFADLVSMIFSTQTIDEVRWMLSDSTGLLQNEGFKRGFISGIFQAETRSKWMVSAEISYPLFNDIVNGALEQGKGLALGFLQELFNELMTPDESGLEADFEKQKQFLACLVASTSTKPAVQGIINSAGDRILGNAFHRKELVAILTSKPGFWEAAEEEAPAVGGATMRQGSSIHLFETNANSIERVISTRIAYVLAYHAQADIAGIDDARAVTADAFVRLGEARFVNIMKSAMVTRGELFRAGKDNVRQAFAGNDGLIGALHKVIDFGDPTPRKTPRHGRTDTA
jgi:hypothetical protein